MKMRKKKTFPDSNFFVLFGMLFEKDGEGEKMGPLSFEFHIKKTRNNAAEPSNCLLSNGAPVRDVTQKL